MKGWERMPERAGDRKSGPGASPLEEGGGPAAVGGVGALGAAWGLLGVAALLTRAIWSLGKAASHAYGSGLTWWQWGLGAGWIATMCFFQGYLGFQRGFSRRVAARAAYLARNPRWPDVALAPLFCMGLVHATRRRRVTSWVLVATMVGLVIGVTRLPQPVRGLIDAGVAAGLAWGLLALVAYTVRALLRRPLTARLDLPCQEDGSGLGVAASTKTA